MPGTPALDRATTAAPDPTAAEPGPRAPLDADVAATLRARVDAGARPLWELTPAQAREASTARAGRPRTADGGAGSAPPAVTAHDLVVPLPGRDLPARHYLPAPGGARPPVTVVFFHGGGFVTGDLDTHDVQARMLAATTGATVVSVAYRLAPEHPFPAAHDDAVDTLRWLRRHADDGTAIAVAGSSAGAGLAATVTWALQGTDAAPVAQLLAYPLLGADAAGPDDDTGTWPGLPPRSVRWYLQHYLPGGPSGPYATDPRFSPLHADAHTGPPTVIALAAHDPLMVEGRRHAHRLWTTGTHVDLSVAADLPHAFWGHARTSPAADRASRSMCRRFADLLTTAARATPAQP